MKRRAAVHTRFSNRRGSALVLVLVLTAAVAALALSAIFLTSSGGILTRYFDREREFRYAAEAALAMGKSRLAMDTSVRLADSGYTTLMSNATITGADGQPLPNVKVNLYGGRTGSTTGQFGLYASLVAEARDNAGSRYVRRLELAEENFARFLDWSNTTIGGCYAKGEYMWGPVWSNARIDVCGGSYAGAEFKDDVGTASYIRWPANGVFKKGYKEWQAAMSLPSTARLSRLSGYASRGSFNFNAPTNGTATTARLRIEFVPVDLNNDGDTIDDDEGFFRVFQGNDAGAVRADWGAAKDEQCGDWHVDASGGNRAFYTVAVHGESWFKTWLEIPGVHAANGFPNVTAVRNHYGSKRAIMTSTGARCYPAGDPRLVFNERKGHPSYTSASQYQKGGTDSTFTPVGNEGQWLRWPGTVPAALTAALTRAGVGRGNEAPYLFPLHRSLNLGSMGVIYVNGTAAVSGVLRGRVTVYTTHDVTFIDDVTYTVDPASNTCRDMLGVIAGSNVTIADNAINTPQQPDGSGTYVFMDDNDDFYLHGVLMALNDTFVPENYTQAGPTAATTCGGLPIGRGCLFQTGGAIVKRREATFTGNPGTGFMEQRSYDRCMAKDSPPYFPTTGRFIDNRYYEIDPVRFNVSQLFQSLTPPPQ